MNGWHEIHQRAIWEWFGVPLIPLLFARMALQWSEIIHLVFKTGQNEFEKVVFFYENLIWQKFLELELSSQKLYYQAFWL